MKLTFHQIFNPPKPLYYKKATQKIHVEFQILVIAGTISNSRSVKLVATCRYLAKPVTMYGTCHVYVIGRGNTAVILSCVIRL